MTSPTSIYAKTVHIGQDIWPCRALPYGHVLVGRERGSSRTTATGPCASRPVDRPAGDAEGRRVVGPSVPPRALSLPRPGEHHLWRSVRSTVALLTRSKAALAVLIGAVVLAVAATGVGYAAMSKTVTLSVDGRTQQVRTFGDNVGDVLKAQGIYVGDHDVVAPGRQLQVADGTTIAVQLRPPPRRERRRQAADRYWVTATDVRRALDQIGLRLHRRRPVRQPRRRHRPRRPRPHRRHPQDPHVKLGGKAQHEDQSPR